jgi:hypothetical protein
VTGQQDDYEIALHEATALLAPKFADIVCVAEGLSGAAAQVTRVADVFIAWMRRPVRVSATRAIEEVDTGEVVSIPREGTMTNIDSSQQARYVLTATDDRGFETDGELAGRLSTEGVVTLTVTQATEGTASGKDEAVAVFAGLGTTTLEIFDSANPDVVLYADVIVANPGGVAAVSAVATVEEIPTP